MSSDFIIGKTDLVRNQESNPVLLVWDQHRTDNSAPKTMYRDVDYVLQKQMEAKTIN